MREGGHYGDAFLVSAHHPIVKGRKNMDKVYPRGRNGKAKEQSDPYVFICSKFIYDTLQNTHTHTHTHTSCPTTTRCLG